MKKQFYLKSLLCLLMMFVGLNAWAAEGDTHDFSQSLSQLLNNNASIASISIDEQDYKIAKVIVTYRTTKSASKVNIACTVGGESWGNNDITSNTTTTMEFTGDALKGAVNLSFTNKSGTGTGKGTFYVSNVQLVEGADGTSLTAPTLDVAAGTYTETQTVKVSNYSEDYIYAYTTDGTNPAFDESLNITNGTAYNHSTGITISQSCTLKILAIDVNGVKSSVVSAAYVLPVVFANLEALVAADLTSGTLVKVSFEDAQIASVYKSSQDKRTGIFLNVQKGGNNIEIYYSIEEVPETWVTGGTVSGTMICPWTLYNGTWELAPAKDTFAWSDLTYTAPAKVKTTPTITATYKPTLTAGGKADTFTVTYDGDGTLAVASSAPAVATAAINGNEVTVTPVAAGTTTISISAPETEEYYSALKSYTLTVNESTPAAELPFSFDGGKADIAKTTGMVQNGISSTDYSSSPKLKFDSQGDYLIVNYASAAKTLTYKLKGNSLSGKYQFDVMESEDGETYTTVHSHTSIGDVTTYTDKLKADSRYVKFVYTTRASGNVALGAINITNEKADPGLAFEQSTYRFFNFTEGLYVSATSAKGSTGAITYSVEEGDKNEIILEQTGAVYAESEATFTIKASIEETEDYKEATATCTVIFKSRPTANSIIVAEADGKYFAMTNTYNDNKYIESVQIAKVGDKYYAADLDAIKYCTTTTDGKTTIVAMNGQYLQATAAKAVSFTDNEYQWTNDGEKLTAATSSHGTLQYNVNSPRFTTYSNKTGQYAQIVSLENVSNNMYYSRDVTSDKYGTICLPYAVAEGNLIGAYFYTATVEGSTVELAPVTALEAGKPYIFQATDNCISVEMSGTPAVASTNGNLTGVLVDTKAPVDSYVLQTQGGVQKFYKVVADKQPTVSANKAYLTTTSSAKALSIGSEDVATAVEALNAITSNTAKIYDINGRELKSLQKGVNIVNGVKVLVK